MNTTSGRGILKFNNKERKMENLKKEIEQLKQEKNAVLLAHYYVDDAVQEIADYVGDSFYLSKVATKVDQDIIVFAGVEFMGESAKILNPEKKVLMPEPGADCPMAHMITIKEIKEILGDINEDIISLKEAGIDVDIVENGKTFEENAIIKAKTIMEMTGQMVLADDSGLEVDAMDKQPGIYSARFMGKDTSYEVKNRAIIDNLKGLEGDKRSARFVCAIAAALPDGEVITTRGTIEGIIADEPKGENGFGYDPIVYVPEYGMTTGEMSPELKNSISHRGKALMEMKKILKEKSLI